MTEIKSELTVTKIESTDSNKLLKYHLTSEKEQLKITIEIPKELTTIQENDKLKILISDQPLDTKNTKISLEGKVQRRTKTEDKHLYLISFGGLQMRIETPKEHKILTPIRTIYLNIN
ncbi:MAG: DNA-directed RNA polymerase subunit G [Candidatus Jordarchaeum sp.]|uniref:DNA-directed RNA polymerase subunit G n=1 Tax=Candidatus Jordarchaeum sp. TaxID=2823881 RepID=UPI00404AAA66